MRTKSSGNVISGRGAVMLLLALAAGILLPAQPTRAQPTIPFRKDRILIIPKAGHDGALSNLHTAERVKAHRKFPALGNIHVFELPPGADPQAVVRRYRQSGHVDAADLDFCGWQPAVKPNDPFFVAGGLWHLDNIGQNFGTPDADIDAPEAWDIINSASNIIVAILDTGVRYTHEDIASNLWTNPGEIAGNGLDDDGNGIVDDLHGIDAVSNSGDPNDDVWGHGTHLAGILGATGNNGLGVCGVAWRVKIMACKFIGRNSAADSDLIQSMDYAMANGAQVLNCSFVVPGPVSATVSNAFWNIRNAGIIVVAAAGNSAINLDSLPYYPASFKMDNIVTVAATTRTNDIWFASNYGATTVHLAAPGVDILSTWNSSNGAYASESGTSMAAAMVSGAVALMLARFPNESYQQIIAHLLAATDPLPSLAGKCITGGRLNLRNALTSNSYSLQGAVFDWVPTNGMTPLTFTNGDGACGPYALPFAFPFYGRNYSDIYVGANGLLGFTNAGLEKAVNSDLPMTNSPNGVVCPYWDDLNPMAGGDVWFGTFGVAPNRKAAVSWVDMPYQDMADGPTRFTFQAILHESGPIAFQYLQVTSGNSNFTQGKTATVGIEDPSGLWAMKHAYNGEPDLVTNHQALLFLPQGLAHPSLALAVQSMPLVGQVQVQLSAEPGKPGAILVSTNLTSWSLLSSNLLPASGVITFIETNATAPQRFFRAVRGPFPP